MEKSSDNKLQSHSEQTHKIILQGDTTMKIYTPGLRILSIYRLQ